MFPRPIRAICFDLDNTLWDVWPVIRRAEQAMYEFLSERYPKVVAALTVEAMREAREQTAARYPQMKHDFTFLRKQTLREHAEEFGYAEAMVEEAFDVFLTARNQVELYEDVLPGLAKLKPNFRLFTASNGNADLVQIGLAHHFERSVAARQVGALKPDPRIFQGAIEGTNLAPEEVVYVGDDPVLDVVGARAAGMQPVWIDRLGTAWPQEIEPPVITVTSVLELADRLQPTAQPI
jgi:FMN hydrolase / 5-amino-6-(5-phospho-D-ribitylamino)uracil phosphatase